MKVVVEYRPEVTYPNVEDVLYPDVLYPELKIKYDRVAPGNQMFSMLRAVFVRMGYDIEHYNTNQWNPMGHIISPGNTVLLKPNLVMDINMAGLGEDCLYTNPALVIAMINYVWIALQGKGRILVADAPVQNCNFDNLIEKSGYKASIDYLKNQGIDIELLDMRGVCSKTEEGILLQEVNTKSGIVVDLGKHSYHAKLSSEELQKIRITNYDPNELLQHHNDERHEYCIAEEILSADVIINMPKPKAHRKAGVTIALKNFVGANVRKEYLPHHRVGDKSHGGDEYMSKSSFLKASGNLMDMRNATDPRKHRLRYLACGKIAAILSYVDKKLFSKQKMREGSWYGNDTIWRTILDLNKIIMYSDKNGNMCQAPQRKIVVCADMIVVGEKEGPLLPSPKHCGIISYSESAVCFDEIIATLMGFDINKLPLFHHVREKDEFPFLDNLNECGVLASNNIDWDSKTYPELKRSSTLNIEPCAEWKGHIELGD